MFLGVDRHGYIAAFDARPDNAAHSMDTDWYAVDRQGRVARMASGEEGAVPWEAHQQYWDELYAELGFARVEALVSAMPDAPRQVLALDRRLSAFAPGALPALWDGVLTFADREMLELFRAETGLVEWRVLDGMPHAVATKDIPRWVFDEYLEAGAIVGAYVFDRPVQPRVLGLFEYSCAFSGPYHRTAVPGDPIRLDELPAPLRSKLGALRLEKIDFGHATEVDPERFSRCRTYR